MGNLPPAHEKESRPELTQNQLHELLESDQARSLIEGAEERGYVEPAELEAFALEHDLPERPRIAHRERHRERHSLSIIGHFGLDLYPL